MGKRKFNADIEVDGKIIKKNGTSTQALMADGTTKTLLERDNKVKILSVHASQLSSLDEAGLVAFYNAQGFVKDDIDTIIFEIDESVNGGGGTGGTTYEPETIAFMQDGDVNISNTSTIYYPGTPQERTGAQLWTAIDNFVKREKAAGRWTKMLCFRPRVGGTALAHAVNLKDISLYRGIYYGSWIHNGQGSEGNGVNTYMYTGLSPLAAGCTDASTGISFSFTNIDTTEYLCVMGYYFGASNRFSFYVQNGANTGGMAPCLFDYNNSKTYPRVAGGIVSLSRTGTTLNCNIRGVAQTDLLNVGGTLVDQFIAEGALFLGANEYNNKHKGKLGVTAVHKGFTNAETTGLASSILQFETDLNRANNW